MKHRLRIVATAASGLMAATWLSTGYARAQLIITPIFASSITSDKNAATIESTIDAALGVYKKEFSNPIDVTMEFQEMSSGLGESDTEYGQVTYSQYLAALTASATSADDKTALAHLPAGPDNPVNGSTLVDASQADLEALGFNLVGFPTIESTISLNTASMNLSRPDANPNKYDLMATVEHEVDEALGLGSALNAVEDGIFTATGPILPEDLFRYAGNGKRSYSTSGSVQSFFSLNGTTDLATFNQNGNGDYGDWFSVGPHTPQVQDAFASQGAEPNPGVEFRALDVVGYNTVFAPEPSSMALVAIAVVSGLPALRVRRRPIRAA